MSGRKKDPIWYYFTEKNEIGKKGCRAICKTCNKEMQGLVARMKSHQLICAKVDSEDHGITEIVTDYESNTCGSEEIYVAPPKPPGLRKRKVLECGDLNQHIVRTTVNQKEEIDCQVARFFYACNISFRSVDHKHFKRLVTMLRPGYIPPNKMDMGNSLLNKIYREEMLKCSTTLAGQTVCMSLDGWSNVHNQPIVCVCIITMEGEVHLVDTIDTSGQPHTSENLTTLSSNAIQSVENKFNCKVCSFVTDNAANMTKMRNELSLNFDVITYGCSAHLLNLLAKDLEIPNISDHVMQVIKYFRNNHFARAKYQENKGTGLLLPSQVRWNTMCDSLESYIKNWPILLHVVEEHPSAIDQNIKNKVTNIMIKRNAQDLVQRLKPISVALDRVQKDNCSIADAVEIWKTLQKELNSLDDVGIKSFEKRYDQALTPSHFLAFLLSPQYDMKVLSSQEKEDAMDLVKSRYDSELLRILLKFIIRAEPFNGVLFGEEAMESLNSLQWWQSFALIKGCVAEKEMKAIEALLTCKATSAGVERMFSTFGLVHNKLRNQLGVEKAAKLVFMFKSLNGKND